MLDDLILMLNGMNEQLSAEISRIEALPELVLSTEEIERQKAVIEYQCRDLDEAIELVVEHLCLQLAAATVAANPGPTTVH